MSALARRERRLGASLVSPAVAVMAAVTLYPMGFALWLSFQRDVLTAPAERGFVGLSNYATVLGSSLFWQDLGATALLTFLTVGVELVLGFCFAAVMHRAVFGRRLVRTAILIPYGMVTVVSAFAWRFAFEPSVGFVGRWIGTDLNFLAHPVSAFAVICLAEIWKTTPFVSLLLLAGLAQVPAVLHEAARMDGATPAQRFFRVTLPNMKAAIAVALLFRTLDGFRIFDSVFVITHGASHTETLSFLTYNQLLNRVDLGLGSAVAVLMFLCMAMVAFALLRGFRLELGAPGGA